MIANREVLRFAQDDTLNLRGAVFNISPQIVRGLQARKAIDR